MSVATIQKRLTEVFLNNGAMSAELFLEDLMESLPEFRTSMEDDADEFMFVITEHSGDIAMVLIEPENKTHINADARARLKALWPLAYTRNMEAMIPRFADDLSRGEFAMIGVKTSQ
ncbi:MAG: hypothetical protein ABI876_10185 [Bacteroidota bacterium]